jgi:hypothetical protein
MNQPPRWTDDQLDAGIQKAKALFRKERLEEPAEAYDRAFKRYEENIQRLLDLTHGLTRLDEKIVEVLTAPPLLEAFRYLAGPPISEDDLAVLAEVSLSGSAIRKNPETRMRVLSIVRSTLDRHRFPWTAEGREPTEQERNAAVVASSALLAVSRVGTDRRNQGKERQELAVQEALISRKWVLVPRRKVLTISLTPSPGEFCRESLLGSEKADFLIGLRDRRVMAVECKVSNSYVNSVKRLNREAAGKAATWLKGFGDQNVVPAGILSGVFKLHNVKEAQERGLTIFWAHDLDHLLNWIDSPP